MIKYQILKEIENFGRTKNVTSIKQGIKFSKEQYLDRKITLLELKILIKSISLNKAAGPDEITNEMLKDLIEIIGSYIVDLFNEWLSNG